MAGSTLAAMGAEDGDGVPDRGAARARGKRSSLTPALAFVFGLAATWVVLQGTRTRAPRPRPAPPRTPVPAAATRPPRRPSPAAAPRGLPAKLALPAGFPADLVPALESELTERETWAVGRDGLPFLPEGGRLPDGALPLIGEDPVTWRPFLDAYPALRRFRDWVAGGGRSDRLPEAVVARLRALDFRLESLQAPRIFRPYLEAAPRAPDDPGPELRGLPSSPVGWLGAAAAAEKMARGLLAELEIQQHAILMGERPAGDLPGRVLGVPIGVPVSMRDYLGGGYTLDGDRVALARWLRPAEDVLRVMLLAAGRSLREEEATAAAAGEHYARVVHHLNPLWFTPLGFEDPADLLGGAPTNPAGWHVYATMCEEALSPREVVGRGRARMVSEAIRARRMCLVDPEETPGHSKEIFLEAVIRLGRLLADEEDHEDCVLLYRQHSKVLLASQDPGVARFLARVARIWAGELVPSRPSADDLAGLLVWMDMHPEALGRPAEANRIQDDLYRLNDLLYE